VRGVRWGEGRKFSGGESGLFGGDIAEDGNVEDLAFVGAVHEIDPENESSQAEEYVTGEDSNAYEPMSEDAEEDGRSLLPIRTRRRSRRY